MPTSPQEQYEFAEDFRKNGFYRRGDVGIDPYKKARGCIGRNEIV